MTSIRVTVDDDDARRQLARLLLLLSDLRGFWPLVVPLFIAWMGRQFESEGAFGGERWAALSPAYAAWKGGGSILYLTGAMRGAASRPSRQVSARSLTLTIEDPKIGFHQEGTDRMPARPVLFEELPGQAETELRAAAETYVRGILARI